MDKFLTTILLAALMGACENTNPDDTQDDTGDTTDLYEASFSATLNQYGWEGDSVVLLESEDATADFIATHEEGETVYGTTPETLELTKGTWSSSYLYDESTMLYIGSASADISATPDLGATLCADLSGDWSCDDGMHVDPFETLDAVMNGCTIVLEGITSDAYPFEVDGNRIYMEGPDGSIIDGVASSDSITMILNRSNGDVFPGTCTRL